ncbi:MAG TPA: sigma 54-interacting transcriptional regulator [Phycisphaerae bacterium]|nr:sigma 54-interacting transcriptional regulator [Phycisphaerae bacterium]
MAQPASHPPAPRTLGQLKAANYRSLSVKDELRKNVIARLRSGTELFPGILGYRESVIPQIVNAILSRHDILFLGLRGQAKTRILRMLPELLDEWLPVLSGTEINDDPLNPITTAGKRLVAEQADDAPIEWIHRSARYHEKLATPDVTIADLIGEIDLVKHAQGRYLSDESTMHFGLIPRTNRGIFAINELPDLAPKIQVGLFNVLEERDIQIRGYPIRLNLDVCMVFSANPEDYTNRGRIVTPLKDRIGSVIRTHYPATVQEGIEIVKQNAWLVRSQGGLAEPRSSGSGGSADGSTEILVPQYIHEILEEFVRQARSSPHINQASGVSVRCSIANAENVVSSAERRAIVLAEKRVVARVDDLSFITASSRGKLELMLAEGENAEDKLIHALLGEAVKQVFSRRAELSQFDEIAMQFKGGVTLQVGDDVPTSVMLENYTHIKGLKQAATTLAADLGLDPKDPASVVSAGEFLLEALYVNNRLSKASIRGKTFFRK